MSHSVEGETLSESRSRLHIWIVMFVLVALGFGIIGIGVASIPRGASRTKFAMIRLGMSDAEVIDLLGRKPDKEVRMFGRIDGPDLFIPVGQQELYQYREWDEARITIITISDPETGQVLCRYYGQGFLDRIFQWLPW